MLSAGAAQPSHSLIGPCPEYLIEAAASKSAESLAQANAAAEQLKQEVLPGGIGMPSGIALTRLAIPSSGKTIHNRCCGCNSHFSGLSNMDFPAKLQTSAGARHDTGNLPQQLGCADITPSEGARRYRIGVQNLLGILKPSMKEPLAFAEPQKVYQVGSQDTLAR